MVIDSFLGIKSEWPPFQNFIISDIIKTHTLFPLIPGINEIKEWVVWHKVRYESLQTISGNGIRPFIPGRRYGVFNTKYLLASRYNLQHCVSDAGRLVLKAHGWPSIGFKHPLSLTPGSPLEVSNGMSFLKKMEELWIKQELNQQGLVYPRMRRKEIDCIYRCISKAYVLIDAECHACMPHQKQEIPTEA